MTRIITLTTDFGEGSAYVAQLKGVILGIAPQAAIVDLSHRIPPQDIRAGALFLGDALPSFPEGANHLAVIDPGVGTERAILIAKWRGGYIVGPDNGLFSLLFELAPPESLFHLRLPSERKVAPTFHGRDLMAPALAHLCMGDAPEAWGDAAVGWVKLALPQPTQISDGWRGEVIAIDPFGNLITNLSASLMLEPRSQFLVRCHERVISGLKRTYGEAMPGEMLALVDSQNRIEVAVACGNAATELDAQIGDEVLLLRRN